MNKTPTKKDATMAHPMNPETRHALYRFYDFTEQLLYIGITHDPGGRWKEHRDNKPWWNEVTNITIETHLNRNAVLEAEREAILTEKPKYNIVHNRKTDNGPTVRTPQLDRLAPFQLGDWVALGLNDGRCPVGEIAAMDQTWISIRLKNFLHGSISYHLVAERWANVERVELAYLEDATQQIDGILGRGLYMNDEHLGEFQTRWEQMKAARS